MRKGLLWIAIISLLMQITPGCSTEVILLKSPGCQKCAAAERVLLGMAEEKNLTLVKYDYFSDDGHRIISMYRAKDVPSVILGGTVIGYRDYEGDEAALEQLILAALANQTSDVRPEIAIPGAQGSMRAGLNLEEVSLYTISAVLGAGLLAGFNPCLIGILVFLAASVLSSTGRRRELGMMVAFFSLGIFTMYLLFGLGVQRLLQAEAVYSAFKYILTALLVLIGLAHIMDAARLRAGRASLFRTDWALGFFQTGLERGRLSSYFLLGALFSLVKAPCVGAIYLAILDLISSRSYLEGTAYLILFNLGVILPVLALGGLMALGTSPDQVDAFRKDHRVGMRLVTGLTLLALAPLIYWQLI